MLLPMPLRRPSALIGAIALALALLATTPASSQPLAALTGPTTVATELRDLLAAEGAADAVVTTWDRDGLDTIAHLGLEGTELRHLPMLLVPGLAADQLAQLAAEPAVRSVWHNESFELHMDESLYTTKAREAWAGIGLDGDGATGEGVELAVIDTGAVGVHADLENIVEFCDTTIAVNESREAVACSPNRDGAGNAFPAGFTGDPRMDARETYHHGSHVAGTIAGTGAASGGRDEPHSVTGVAPDATLRIYSANVGPTLQAWQILSAFDDLTWKKENGFNDVVAVNNSWGGGSGSDYDPDNPQAVAFKAAFDAGILPVFSAGNSGPNHNTIGVQCASPWVLCVGANTKPDSMAGFSSVGRPASPADTNRDGAIDDDDVAPDNHDRAIAQAFDSGIYRVGITAPGVDINAPGWYDAQPCTHEDYGDFQPGGCYEVLSGTSMSAPHVTGAIGPVTEAFRQANDGGDPTPNQLMDILERSAVTLPGVPAEAQGAGRLDVREAVRLARSYPDGPGLTVGTPLPTFAEGMHPGAEGTFGDSQVGCTMQESWTTNEGYGHHTVTVPERAERLQVTVDWEDHNPGANLYIRVFRPGVDPDGTDEDPGPDRVFADGENAGLVFLPFAGLDGAQRVVTLPQPEDGEWSVRIYHRASASGPLPCPSDSDEDPQNSGGYGYDLHVETPLYVDSPEVTLHEGDTTDDARELFGSASYPEPMEGITTYAVPGTGPEDDDGDEEEGSPANVRVTDLTDSLRIAWDDTGADDTYVIHRSTDPSFTADDDTIVASTDGQECHAPNVPSWPTASRDGLCWTDTDVSQGETYYYRVAIADSDRTSRLAYGTVWPIDREVRVKVDRIYGPGYWEFADETNADATAWSYLWDLSGVTDPSEPLARSFSQGVGSATAPITEPTAPIEGDLIRLDGQTRVQTAVRISVDRYDRADTVVIARADEYPDALAGTPLATLLDAPILLTYPEGLHPDTATEIERLQASTALLLGGHAALSAQVEADLVAAGVDPDRVDGRNRFDTAALIADRLGDRHETAMITEGAHADPGRGWPDALTAAPYAAHTATPILLVTHDLLPAETAAALSAAEVATTTIVGGPAAVSSEVEAELAERGHGPGRISGATRYETSRAVFDAAVASGMDPDRIWLATGRNWPDALTAGAAVATLGSSLMLVDGADLQGSPPTRELLAERSDTIEHIVLIGGGSAISAATEAQVRALIE
jgi:putative cell wall-binding protein